jgi:hypothetical protein
MASLPNLRAEYSYILNNDWWLKECRFVHAIHYFWIVIDKVLLMRKIKAISQRELNFKSI